MGIFDLLKKKGSPNKSTNAKAPDNELGALSSNSLVSFIRSNLDDPSDENVLKAIDLLAKPADDLEHLTPEGELPWGWHTANKEFTTQIKGEYSYFLHEWIESIHKSPKENLQALNSFVIYLDDAGKLCESKGECFEFWFYEVLVRKDYIAKRKSELNDLFANIDKLQANFEKKNNLLSDLDDRIIKMLIENANILQSDFVKMFDPLIQNDVREKLYFMEKSGELEREKSGRSYILHYNKP